MSRKLVDAWFDAFRSKDISKLELAEDFVHTSPFGEIKGRQVYLDMVMKNADAFFSRPIKVVNIFDCGDKLAARYLVGETPACDCFYIQDDQISRTFSYYHLGEKPVL